MRKGLLPVLFVLATTLAATSALARATASITINARPLTLLQSGFTRDDSQSVFGLTLNPGQTADFAFDYTIAVQDDGLAAEFDASAFECLPIHDLVCGPGYNGHEIAVATLNVAYRDGRVANRFISVSADTDSSVTLQTHGDSFAERLSQSGTIRVHVFNTSMEVQSDGFLVYAAEWVLANPIPEPSTVIQVALGLSLVGLVVRSRRRENRDR
jgi:hypothetical protein